MSFRNLSFVLLFSTVCIRVFAQSANVEKLLALYENESYQEVVHLADSLLDTNTSEIPRIIHIKADALYFLGDLEASLEAYLQTIATGQDYESIYLAQANSHAGFCLKYLGRNVEALPYYHEALNLSRQVNDSVEIANQLSSLGGLYSSIGQYDQAVRYLNECYEIDFALMDTVALAYDLTSLGDLKCQISDYQEAIQYYRQALRVKESIGNNYSTYSIRLGKMAEAFLKARQADSAMHYVTRAIDYSINHNDSLTLAKQWITQSQICKLQGDYTRARQLAQKALDYFSQTETNQFQIAAAIALAESLEMLKQVNRARQILINTASLAEEKGLYEEQRVIYKNLSLLAEKAGDMQSALAFYKQYQVVQDSLQVWDKQNAILALDQEYRTTEKEQKIALLTTQNELTQLTLDKKRREQFALIIVIILILMIAGFVGYAIYMRSRLKERLLSQEIENLRLRINSLMDGSTEGLDISQDQLNKRLFTPLSEREFEILMLAVSDKSNKEIADQIFVSVNTVKFHLKNIYEKLGVSNRKEALQFAINPSKG